MIQRDYLIVGGGVAAASACEAMRQHDPKGSATLVSGEAFLPYQRPPLSKTPFKGHFVAPEKLLSPPYSTLILCAPHGSVPMLKLALPLPA